MFSLTGLAPGKYTVQVSAPTFGTFENTEVDVTTRAGQLDVTLKVTIDQQKVTVSADAAGVNTDPENNVGALVLRGTDLESLPDDPDDLAAALQALACWEPCSFTLRIGTMRPFSPAWTWPD